MQRAFSLRFPSLPAWVIPLALALALPGCTLLGLGAAAGATVGGCALLDTNEDESVTQEELSAGLYDAWDTTTTAYSPEPSSTPG